MHFLLRTGSALLLAVALATGGAAQPAGTSAIARLLARTHAV